MNVSAYFVFYRLVRKIRGDSPWRFLQAIRISQLNIKI